MVLELQSSARLIGETILMAYVGTLTGAIVAFALNFVASPDITGRGGLVFVGAPAARILPDRPGHRFRSDLRRRFRPRPFAGRARARHPSAGALGKQFFETTENIDMKPVEGLRASGVGVASHPLRRIAAGDRELRHYALLRFEINVRGATVLGFVGAGGIGQDLMEAIRKFYYSDVSAILVMIIAVVMTIDISTQYLRRALISEGR